MTIRKVGNKFCVYSKDGSKKLGCYPNMEGAQKRLKQVDYFKHLNAMEYEKIFENFKLENTEACEQFKLCDGSIAGFKSEKLLDNKEHFPVITPTQAQSSLSRVMKLGEIPDWFSGSLDELKYLVYNGAKEAHPNIDFKVSVPIATALSDGQSPSDTKTSNIKDPNDVVKSKVPSVPRPTLAEIWESTPEDKQLSLGQNLIDALENQQEMLANALDLANRLIESGLDGDEFSRLSSYLQEDIVRNLTQNGVSASRKQELLLKLTGAKKKLDPNAGIRNRGDVVFPANSSKVKDNKDHFPINSEAQARNALARVAQYSSVPSWYSGTLEELQAAVRNAVSRKYKGIEVTKPGKK